MNVLRKHDDRIRRQTALAAVDLIRDKARDEHGNPGSAHRRSALGQVANELDRMARRG